MCPKIIKKALKSYFVASHLHCTPINILLEVVLPLAEDYNYSCASECPNLVSLIVGSVSVQPRNRLNANASLAAIRSRLRVAECC